MSNQKLYPVSVWGILLRSASRAALGVGLLAGASSVSAEQSGRDLAESGLAPLSGPRGATLFAQMTPEQTGIVTENRYDDPKMWAEHHVEIAMGSMGTGVAVGDYDNDGRPDVFAVSKTGVCRLFRNLGGWKFEDATEKSGVGGTTPASKKQANWLNRAGGQTVTPEQDIEAWRQGAVFADVNNDGWLDLYLCRFKAPNLLFINQQDGTFKEEGAARGLAVTDASGVGAFCDYDRDGWLDVYVTTNMLEAALHPKGQRDYLFHNNGDGTFTDVTDKAGIYGETQSHSATWWDYDNDGWSDLFVSNDFEGADRLYRNNRDGTFTDAINQAVPDIPYSSMGADVGDVDNDGRLDFLIADMAATIHEKDHRGMAYSRALDNAAVGVGPLAAEQHSRSMLYLNKGVGRCLEVALLAGVAATDWTWSPRFEDLDNDGRVDLFVTNGMNREYQNADLRNRMFQAEDLAERMRIMRMSPKLMEANLAYRNLGELRFEEVGASWGLNQRDVSFGSAFGDFDGDGDLDVVYGNYESGMVVLRNDSESGSRLIVALRGTQSNRFGVGVTVRIESSLGVQVRTLVVSRGYLSSSEPVLHFGLGDDQIVDRLTVEWPSGQIQSFARLPVNRKFTITEPSAPRSEAVHTPSAQTQFVEVGRAQGFALSWEESARRESNAQPLVPMMFRNRGPALAMGDFDGDNRDDVLVGGTSATGARILLGASERFTPLDASVLANRTLVDDGPVLVFDADGDGANDILMTRAGTVLPLNAPPYQPQLYLNDGQGAFRLAPDALPSIPISVGAVAAADFGRNGRLGVFIGGRVRPGQYPTAPRSVLLLNHGGRFEDVTEAFAPGLKAAGMVSSALWSDVDSDGWPDLLLALEWGPVKYFHNEKGTAFTEQTEAAGFAAAGTGWWTSLAAADFNHDGRPDIVAGNVGLNTLYRASHEHPALIYVGNFAPGRPQLIEAYYEGGKLFPWRTRMELGSVIPPILQRFPKNDQYARATLQEILSAEKIASARRFAATELRSGVFVSQADGTYRFSPLPRLAQIAPFQGLAAGDFDGDGHADVYALQNSYAPSGGIGRFDGGLSQLLSGDGRGNFLPVAPAESGLVVSGDAKALVVTDFDGDGWPDFLVTRNRSDSLAWRNTGRAGHHAFAVRLRGSTTNPTAVGARIGLELADGTKQTGEIFAGGGYYSQSSAAVFFGYPAVNPPKRISVVWPDGVTSVHPLPASPPAALVLSHP